MSETQQLPECMKICFLALYNTTNEIANEIQKEKGCGNPLLPHLKEVVLLVKYLLFFQSCGTYCLVKLILLFFFIVDRFL